MSKGMTAEDIKYVHGKGHICNLCRLDSGCYKTSRSKKIIADEEGLYNIAILIYACDLFERREKS